jgi:hypothetical protein
VRRTGSITILGLLQSLALILGIFLTAVCLKFSAPIAAQVAPQSLPTAFKMATWFAHYGISLGLFILIWVVCAVRVQSGKSEQLNPSIFPFVSGILVFSVIAGIGVYCSLTAALILLY